jgi:sugar-specific transcriptional regulator TrmB
MAVLMNAKEISEELGISKTLAYEIMQKLNKELEAKGYFVIKGKVSRRYLSEQIYGMPKEN